MTAGKARGPEMSDERVADMVLRVRLPKKPGKKTVKIELFHAGQFRYSWSENLKRRFIPSVPLRYADRDTYWAQQIYRLRIDGRWHGPARYTFLSWRDIVALLEDIERGAR